MYVIAGAAGSNRHDTYVIAGAAGSNRHDMYVIAGAAGSNRHDTYVIAGAAGSNRHDTYVIAGAAGSNRHDTYVIAGAAQKRPTNFTAALRNNSLVKFLVTSWEDKSNADIFNGKKIYATYNDKCYLFKVIDGEVVKEEDRSLSSSHEEADFRMLFHCKNLQGSKNVVVCTNDTGVLIIFLGNMEKLNPDLKIWLEVGIQAQNNLHYIDVKKMFDTLGSDLCRALPGFHVFTGSDYTASFSGRGKIRPLKLLEKNQKVMDFFFKLIKREFDSDQHVNAEKMYGQKKLFSVDEARLEMFLKKYKPKKQQRPHFVCQKDRKKFFTSIFCSHVTETKKD